jgi:hypothetical protein
MYRIRLSTGEEAVYRSAEELALAVASGVVSPRCEVFHNSAHRWLPIELHPDYRAVVTGKRPALASCGPVVAAEGDIPGDLPDSLPATSVPERFGPGTPPQVDETLAGPSAEVSEAEYDPSKDPTPVTVGLGQLTTRSEDPASVRRLRLIFAIGAAVVALVVAGGFFAWRRLIPLLEQRRSPATLSAGMAPEPAPPGPSAAAFAAFPAPSPPRDPTASSRSADTVTPTESGKTSRVPAAPNSTRSYFAAYADARAEMDDALSSIDFRRVFAASRLGIPESLRTTRRMVQAAANILRVYRGREVMLEQTYRPADPGGAGTFREPFETAEAARSLLGDVDSLFGILVAQEGRLRFDGTSFRFSDPEATGAYAGLRERILAALATWRDSTESRNLVTVPRLERALGPEGPPPARR